MNNYKTGKRLSAVSEPGFRGDCMPDFEGSRRKSCRRERFFHVLTSAGFAAKGIRKAEGNVGRQFPGRHTAQEMQ